MATSPAKRAKAGMPTIASVFASCKKEGRPAFIPYLTAGFPTMASTVPLLLALEKGGADIIELGMHGPTIQKSSFDALANGVKMDDCFRYVTEARAAGLKAPIVLMGYTNPFVSYGEEKLATRSLEVGVEGFIVVDMPPDDAGLFSAALEARGLSFIPLVAPTSADARLKLLAGIAKGYVYAVSLTGVTGSRSELSPELPAFVGRVRKAFGADFPIVVGFGLSTPEHVQQVSGMGADGAVVGSSVIQEIRKHSTLDAQAAALTLYVKHITGR